MRLLFPNSFTPWQAAILIIALFVGCGKESTPTQDDKQQPPIQATSPLAPETRDQRLQTAARLVETGAIDQAERKIRRLLIESPDDLQVNTLMLRVMTQREEFAEAVRILDHMAQLDPDRDDDIQAHAANLLYQEGEFDQAIIRLESVLQRSPEFDEARRRLAQMLNQQGYMFDANEHIRKLLANTSMSRDELISLIFPSRSWISDGDIERADDEQKIGRLGVLNIATLYRINGNPRKSLQYLDNSDLVTKQKHPAAIALYAHLLADAQMHKELHAWVAAAPSQCERYPDYWIACGNVALDNNDEAAIDCFVEAIKREPNSMDAHYGIITSLEKFAQSEIAERFRQRSYALDSINRDAIKIRQSPSPEAQNYIDLATQLMNIGRPLEAIAWQELALNRFSPSSNQAGLIPTYKARVLSEFPSGRDESLLLCELDRKSLRSAHDWLTELRIAAPDRPVENDTSEGLARTESPLIAPVFQNVAEQVGIAFRYQNAPLPVEREFQIFQAFGGGVACLDFDRDGSVDFYFGQAATTPPEGKSTEPNGLFRNQSLHFVNVIDESAADDRGYTVGVTAGDWNQDGFEDLLFGNLGRNRLLINQGDGTFRTDTNAPLGENSSYTSSVAMADVTGDMLPDIVEVNYLDDDSIFEPIQYGADGKPVALPGPLQFQPAMDRVLVSLGDGSMAAQPLGGQDEPAYSTGLALLITDIDWAPGNEVFVANDLRANQLWVRNQKDKSPSEWSDAAVSRGVAYGNSGQPKACMGVAAADFDGNGRLDLHISNFEDEWSNHYMQNKSGVFVDATVPYKLDTISRKMLGFGTQAIDYDNNNQWDLIVGNGHIEDLTAKGSLFAMPTQLLVGRRDGFIEHTVAGDDEYWNAMHFSRAMAKCDYNRDGRVDVVVSDLKRDAVLLENQTITANHWLQLELVGTISEREAIGAHVTADFDSTSLYQTVQTGDGYLAKNESVVFFGLGASRSVARLHVRWPSGLEQVFENLNADTRWMLVEGTSTAWRVSDPAW
ncbi:tetratricopeptide repeat protein [Planctomycetes bacterium CA13]|uniref:Tetratricopeptide repeat protein n=1 Tax=Novipirellula herctigrandis TaxID=2527986 RepID=A0A5C5ZCS9_9BACT|nr:tetratricopeptide repeat protein [Planctomycetes bacterium CA13]